MRPSFLLNTPIKPPLKQPPRWVTDCLLVHWNLPAGTSLGHHQPLQGMMNGTCGFIFSWTCWFLWMWKETPFFLLVQTEWICKDKKALWKHQDNNKTTQARKEGKRTREVPQRVSFLLQMCGHYAHPLPKGLLDTSDLPKGFDTAHNCVFVYPLLRASPAHTLKTFVNPYVSYKKKGIINLS